MEAALKIIGKSFTRFFMPGLVFTLFAVLFPIYIFFSSHFTDLSSLMSSGNIVVSSFVLGYLLDSAGLYKWSFHVKIYESEKSSLATSLKEISQFDSIGFNDPDSHVYSLWQENEKLYDRLMAERAEWVLVLETAFALLFSSFIIILFALYFFSTASIHWQVLFLPAIGIPLSFLISSKGIQRMQAHNLKLIFAVKHHYKNNNPSTILIPDRQ